MENINAFSGSLDRQLNLNAKEFTLDLNMPLSDVVMPPQLSK